MEAYIAWLLFLTLMTGVAIRKINRRIDELDIKFKKFEVDVAMLSNQWEAWKNDYNTNVKLMNKTMIDITVLMKEFNQASLVMKEALPIIVEIKTKLPMIQQAAQKLQEFNNTY